MKNKGSASFDELKRQLKNLEKDIQIKQYDYSSNETNKAISKTLENFRRQMIGTIWFSNAENKRCAI